MEDVENENSVKIEEQISEEVPQVQEEPQVELEFPEEKGNKDEKIEENEESEEVTKKRKYHIDGKGRIRQLTKEKYDAQRLATARDEEVKKLRSEVERLNKLTEQSSQAAMTHYDDSVKLKSEQAKLKLTKAIQEGDVEQQLNATEELASAKAQQLQIDSWNANQQYLKQQRSFDTEPVETKYVDRQSNRSEDPVDQPELTQEAYDWLKENPWFNPKSEEFNEHLAREVQSYEALLYNRMLRSGKEDKILSREYFDQIDNYINHEIYGEPESQPKRILNMRQNRSSVAPVNRGVTKNMNSTPTFKLPHGIGEGEFKNFISNLGVSEKEYMQNLKEDLIKQDLNMKEAIRRGRI